MGQSAPIAVRPAAPVWHRAGAAIARRLPVGRYRFAKSWSRAGTPAFWGRAGARVGAFRFVCDLRDSTAREVYFTGKYEPQETSLVRAILSPGQTLVDVGANWGYFSLTGAGRVGTAGRVVAFEPDPRLADLLDANVAANGFGNITLVRAAAAAEPGQLRLEGFAPEGGNWGLSRMTTGAVTGAVFEARATPIDAELDALGVGKVDLLKLDVEGAEDLALAGMQAGLAGGRYRRLLIEFHPQLLAARGQSTPLLIAQLLEFGYQAWEIRHDPAFTRRAAYRDNLDAREVLSPWEPGRPLADWPHFLFAQGDPLP